MAHILHQAIGGPGMMAFWYHFAILFEALFILTAVDAGTRAGRFMLQDLLGNFVPALKRTESLPANLIATGLCVAAWGYFLYQGVVDPLGGIQTLWPLFGISNQMLAGIALMLGTVVLFKMKRDRYAWTTILPAAWLLICTMTAGWQKIFSADPKGKVLAPAKSLEAMERVIFNDAWTRPVRHVHVRRGERAGLQREGGAEGARRAQAHGHRNAVRAQSPKARRWAAMLKQAAEAAAQAAQAALSTASEVLQAGRYMARGVRQQ
ncbi:carbon starvation protein A [Ditylenchus destructor]|nr:carbon starvation protein A [Ditylenchus destructor]